MFYRPSLIIEIKSELNRFISICNENNYTPSSEDIKEIILYIRDNSASYDIMLKESDNTFFESLDLALNENMFNDLGITGDDRLVSGVKSLFKGEKDPNNPGGIAYIKYLFKKGKVKGAVNKEKALNLQLIGQFAKLAKLKSQLAKLENTELPSMKSYMPSFT